METNINFNGISAQPSDYIAADGDLQVAMNLVSENGSLIPAPLPKFIAKTKGNIKPIYIHKTTLFSNFILQNTKDDTLYAVDHHHITDQQAHTAKPLGVFPKLKEVKSIGNALVVLTEQGINYFLWKEQAYHNLGTHLPELKISFGLKGKPVFDDFFVIETASGWTPPNKRITKDQVDDRQKNLTEQVMARVNKFMNEQTIEQERFAQPFFLRYAYRLYDGTLTQHSAPILLCPATAQTPHIQVMDSKDTGGVVKNLCSMFLVPAKINFQLIDNNNLRNELNNWQDIIKAVEIFITKPIFTYDQEGPCYKDSYFFFDTEKPKRDTKFIGELELEVNENAFIGTSNFVGVTNKIIVNGTPVTPENNPLKGVHTEWTYANLYRIFERIPTPSNHDVQGKSIIDDQGLIRSSIFYIEGPTEKEFQEKLEQEQVFYHLATIEPDQLPFGLRKELEIKRNYLKGLTGHEVMTDDYLTHDTIVADSAQVYNNRLNLTGIKRKLFKGFEPSALWQYINRSLPTFQSFSPDRTIKLNFPQNVNKELSIDVYIRENGKVFKVTEYAEQIPNFFSNLNLYKGMNSQGISLPKEEYDHPLMNGMFYQFWPQFFFYPNTNAFKIIIRQENKKIAFQLKAHTFLNGAYTFFYDKREDITNTLLDVDMKHEDEPLVEQVNRIYTSEVNNPFFFPPSNITAIPDTEVLAMATAAKALSQGQFGQFPLYAFTTNGVWALSVNDRGLYNARQPITRDVLIDKAAITQIDSAVIFITQRGIMMLEGAQTTCISDVINGEGLNVCEQLPGLKGILNRVDQDDFLPQIEPFHDFMLKAKMLYDYPHQVIILYNPAFNYSYIFSLKSKRWTMMNHTHIDYALNSYPEAYAVDIQYDSQGQATAMDILDFADPNEHRVSFLPNIIVSRPIKLQAPNIHKTISAAILRGLFFTSQKQMKEVFQDKLLRLFPTTNAWLVLYASNDLYNWQPVWSSNNHILRGFSGSPFKYYKIVVIAFLQQFQSIQGLSVVYQPKLNNQLR